MALTTFAIENGCAQKGQAIHIPIELYTQMYLKENLSNVKIAELLGVSAALIKKRRSTVWKDIVKSQEAITISAETTMLEKHGVTNAFLIPANQKLGTEAAKSLEAKAKRVQTNLARYGFKTPAENDEVKAKIANTNMERFGRASILTTKVSNTEIIATREAFTDYLAKNPGLDSYELSVKLGYNDPSFVNRLVKKFDCESLIKRYYKTSKPETEIIDYIRSIKPEIKVVQSARILGRKEIDILLPELNIGIEYHGLYWHSDKRVDRKYHQEKREVAARQGIHLIQIFESEWLQKPLIVKDKISALLGANSKKIFARKTVIKEVPTALARQFFNDNHIQGYNRASLKIGLFFDNELVAAMTFLKTHRNKADEIDLDRFATKLGTSVVGGFSKLLKYGMSVLDVAKIITFADLRYSNLNSNVYSKNSFVLEQVLPPNYFYFGTDKVLRHRYGFRKDRLQRLLPDYDPNLTEFENIDSHSNLLRIFDAGNARYVKNVF